MCVFVCMFLAGKCAWQTADNSLALSVRSAAYDIRINLEGFFK